MSGKYFCYDCQVVVPAIQPSARRGLTCLYCLREAVEKIGEEEDCWDEDAPGAMNDPQLDSALNLLEQLTVEPSSALPYGVEEDNIDDYYYNHETYDSDYDGLPQLDSFPSSPLPVDAIDDSFSDTPSFLAGYLGIDDPDGNDDWAPINDSITSYLINDEFDEDFYSIYSGDNHDNYDDLLENMESPFLTEPHEQFDDFMLQLMETRQRLMARGDDTLEGQALPLDWLYDTQPPRPDALDQSRFDALSSRILGEDDHVIQTKTDCVICQEAFQTNMTLVRMACNHEYHKDCLLPWLHQSPTCPICRTTL